jgi:hypothetical protein
MVISHSQALSGLSANTLYHYRVRSRDAAGNLATSGDSTFRTALAPDTTAPTVSLSAPAAGATVSGVSTVVSATASDNVGVVGVQFKLDGENLGTEDLASPYSINWDTTQVADGSHVLSAVARDAAGNTRTSTTRTVTVANQTTTHNVTAYAIVSGSFYSGSIQNLASDDNRYFVTRSTTSGSSRTSAAAFEFRDAPAAPVRLDLTVRLKSSVASTDVRLYAYNFATATWLEIANQTVGTSEVTMLGSVASDTQQFVSSTGQVGIEIVSNGGSRTHNISDEIVQLTITR